MSVTVSTLFPYLPESAGIFCPHPENKLSGIKRLSDFNQTYEAEYLYVGEYDEARNAGGYENLTFFLHAGKKPGKSEEFPKNNVILIYGEDEFEHMIASVAAIVERGCARTVMTEELLEMLGRGCEIQEIMDYAYARLLNPLMLVDASFHYLVSAGADEIEDEPLWEYTLKKGIMPEFFTNCIQYDDETEGAGARSEQSAEEEYAGDMLRMKDEFNEYIKRRMFFKKVINKGHVIGYLCLMEDEARVTQYDISVLGLVGNCLSAELAKSVGRSGYSFTLIENFVLSLLKNSITNPEEIEMKQKLFEIRLRPTLYVVTVTLGEKYKSFDSKTSLLAELKAYFRGSGGVLTDSGAVLLYDTEKTDEQFRTRYCGDFARFLRVKDCHANISYPFEHLRDLYRHYRQTLYCIEMRDIIEYDDPIVFYDDIVDYHMIYVFREVTDLRALIHRGVEILRKADEENDSDYLDTLLVYLRCGQNLSDAAKVMELHYNTMKYRLNRIVAMTKIDLKNPDEVYRLLLSEKVLKVMGKGDTTIKLKI